MVSKNVIKIPGLVDVHVHFREPGATHKEDLTTGTQAAVAGGYTTVLDMPNNNPPTTSQKELDEKIKRSKGRVYCDIGFNFGGTKQSSRDFEKVGGKATALKVYMNKTTGSLLTEDDEETELIFRLWNNKTPIMVHAIGETVNKAITLAKKYSRDLHICHITADQLNSLKLAKKNGLPITAEVCPHHLFLTSDDLKQLGHFGLMLPPLGSKKDQQKLWDNLDYIDMIATDHAPHTKDEKNGKEPVYGVPGLETVVPLFFPAIDKGLLTLDKFVQMTSTMPRKIFKLPEQSKTHTLIERTKKYKLSEKKLFTKCGWSPFLNFGSSFKVKSVFLRGQQIYEQGKFLSAPAGQVIYPKK